MPLEVVVLLVVSATVVVALWGLSTDRRRDEVARDFARQVFLVDGIAEASADDARIRALQPFMVRSAKGARVVLAASAEAAAELVATSDGDEVAVSCLLGRHRVVPLGGGRWAVAALPSALGFLGKPCVHGGVHP